MLQDSLWGSAPLPVAMTVTTSQDHVTRTWTVLFNFVYSQRVEGSLSHFHTIQLDETERPDISSVLWAADRYFWKNRPVRQIKREINLALAKHRTAVEQMERNRNPWREVVMP